MFSLTYDKIPHFDENEGYGRFGGFVQKLLLPQINKVKPQYFSQ